ncbi:hypothetical protein CWC38_09230 [Kocuria tytonicola]|uniref:Uncharacterized protein n=1 Tax=Kocuria tytonicola TaxID=2055946 RepID=A0A3L9KXV4_9MICC|nr:hypothetical protein [Kocuria tytonicola]RLY91190.1 hypothetical protein EAE32_11475 [Kocuria tytonicola]RLZ02794.1 hypothetical protein CWC38_09230 [Kocuria tytonicola]
MSSVISTYLQDHHAGSAAGVDAFRRVAEFHGDERVREEVGRLAAEVEADQTALEEMMAALGVKPAPLKDLPARAAEKVARLKPNERFNRRSPLSDVEELEALVAAVHAKGLGWRLLLEVPDDRLDSDMLRDLHARALEQERTLEQLRLGQAGKLTQS